MSKISSQNYERAFDKKKKHYERARFYERKRNQIIKFMPFLLTTTNN